MVLAVNFRRDDACAHSSLRECTACFLMGMRHEYERIFGPGFEEAWRMRTVPGPEEMVDSFEVFARLDNPDEQALQLHA